jgi:hypothetical protein
MEIEQNYIDILRGILEESCQDGKIVSRTVMFSKFEREAKSGMEIYRFKKALSFLINKGIIAGYCIKTGRNGGVYKPEKVTVICSYGKFEGHVSKAELSGLISSLKQQE